MLGTYENNFPGSAGELRDYVESMNPILARSGYDARGIYYCDYLNIPVCVFLFHSSQIEVNSSPFPSRLFIMNRSEQNDPESSGIRALLDLGIKILHHPSSIVARIEGALVEPVFSELPEFHSFRNYSETRPEARTGYFSA